MAPRRGIFEKMHMPKRPTFWPRCCLAWLLTAPLLAQNPASPNPASAGSTAPHPPVLAFDAQTKRYEAAPGESIAPFTYNLTNIWTNEVVIHRVQSSCGCTTAKLPFSPWRLAPGASGEVHAFMNLTAKMGLITKPLTFILSEGTNNLTQVVTLVVNIPLPPAMLGSLSGQERQAAMAQAQLNPQAIFQGDCASCHAAKGLNAYGQDLYAADCGICHESSRRASAVPDLHALKQPTDLDYWKILIANGKPHTMMPAFARSQGGPLSQEQITSLATYLDHTISHHLSPVLAHGAPAAKRAIIVQ
jgi:mono/diheme cytochrome c family protein